MHIIQKYEWPEYRMLVSYSSHGYQHNYAVLCDHCTFEDFFNYCLEARGIPPIKIDVMLIGDDVFEMYEQHLNVIGG